METAIREINRQNLSDAEKCNGIFTVDSKLVLAAENNVIRFNIVRIIPYQKQYSAEIVNYEAYINNPDMTIFFAYSGKEISGRIRLRRNWNHYAYVEDFVVDVKFRRRGVGRNLIEKAIDWAKEKQLPGIMIETQNNNVAACLFYQQCGFELTGFDRMLYRGLNPDTEEIALFWYLKFKPEN